GAVEQTPKSATATTKKSPKAPASGSRVDHDDDDDGISTKVQNLETETKIQMQVSEIPRTMAGRMNTAESTVAKFFDFRVGKMHKPVHTVEKLQDQLKMFPIPNGDVRRRKSMERLGEIFEDDGKNDLIPDNAPLVPKLELREQLYNNPRAFPALSIFANKLLSHSAYQKAHINYFARCEKDNDVPVPAKSLLFLEQEHRFQEKRAVF
ncbi:unnamed protein product, partial [Amoebophrya sp. A120]